MWTPLPDPLTRGLWTSHGLGLPIQLKYPPLCFVPAPLELTVSTVGSTVVTPAGEKLAVMSMVSSTPHVKVVSAWTPVAAYTPNPIEGGSGSVAGGGSDPVFVSDEPANEPGGC